MYDEDEDEEEYEDQRNAKAFMERLARLERYARKHGGYIKWVPVKPTKLKAYAAKMYRAVSGLGWNIPDLMPGPGEVCAFSLDQWQRYQQDWIAYSVMLKAGSRLTIAVVVGEATAQVGQTFVKNPKVVYTL